MGKKAQLTIFIIVGLVLIIVSSLLFISANSNKLKYISSSSNTNLKEIEPVKSYIEQSIQNLVIEGIFLIGKQGGKIYSTTWPACKEENPGYEQNDRMCNQKGDLVFSYPPYVSSSPYKYKRIAVGINDSRHDTWTQALRTDEYFPLQQPFAYLHQEGPGLLPSQEKFNGSINNLYGWEEPLPPIKRELTNEQSIEGQLSNWTKNHLKEVLNFTYFELTGYDVTLIGDPSVKVSINEDDVTATVNYTVMVKKAGNTYELDEFYARVPYNFRRFYMFIMRVIQDDIISLDPIYYLTMKDEEGNIISKTEHMESNPQNFMYDVINITDLSLDFQLNYNTEEQHFSFYFIRENRAPDAGTVFAQPALAVYGQVPQTWYCFNYETTGAAFLDPDEDDQFHKDPFPFQDPKWYQWYSRGDYMQTITKNYCQGGGLQGCPIVVGKIWYHNEPDSKSHGLSGQFNGLNACGNEKDAVGPYIGQDDDVGDVLILKTGDQMDYEPGGGIIAPLWYVDSPVIESGFGRLNDVQTFRPIKCIAGQKDPRGETCQGGYWRFNQRAQNDYNENYCTQSCNVFDEVDKCPGDPLGPCLECKQVSCHCYTSAYFYLHANEKGNLVPFPERKTDDAIVDDCVAMSHPNCKGEAEASIQGLCGGNGNPPPEPEEPPKDGKFKPVCCTSEDGVCNDINIPVSQSGCGNDKPLWTLISESKFCNQVEDCLPGCCKIRGKEQVGQKQKYECIATCVESNSCTCTGDDLSSCTGEYSWSEGVC